MSSEPTWESAKYAQWSLLRTSVVRVQNPEEEHVCTCVHLSVCIAVDTFNWQSRYRAEKCTLSMPVNFRRYLLQLATNPATTHILAKSSVLLKWKKNHIWGMLQFQTIAVYNGAFTLSTLFRLRHGSITLSRLLVIAFASADGRCDRRLSTIHRAVFTMFWSKERSPLVQIELQFELDRRVLLSHGLTQPTSVSQMKTDFR